MPIGYILLLGVGAFLLFSKKSEAKTPSEPKPPLPEEPKPPVPEQPKPEQPKPEQPKPEQPEAPKGEPNVERAPDAWLKKGLAQADLARVRYKRADGKLHIYEVTTPLTFGKVCEAIALLKAVQDGFYFDADCNRVKSDVPLEALLDDNTSVAIVRPKGEPIGDKRTNAGKWFIITSTGENRV